MMLAGTCVGVALLWEAWTLHSFPAAAAGDALGEALVEGRALAGEVAPGSQPCSPAALEALQDAVRAQADAVRALKSQPGVGKQVRGVRGRRALGGWLAHQLTGWAACHSTW
jgi:hypothetical protein